MKTLRKSLSFVLVLALVLGMVCSAFAASFTDAAKITNTEAVKVLNTVKVIDGFTDGSFGPTNGLTRGQACAFAARLALGREEADKQVAVEAPFKDVAADATFAGYIAYCKNQGWIDGYADGTFKSGNALTTVAFAKMLLGALGYKSENEGFTGAGWGNKVQQLMNKTGLNKNLVNGVSGACTREDAAQLMLNTLKADCVYYYGGNVTVQAGGATVTVGNSAAILETCTPGVGTDRNINDDGVVQFAEKYYPTLKLVTGTPTFGRPVAYKWTYGVTNETVVEADIKEDLVATFDGKVTTGTMYNTLGKTVYDDVASAGAFAIYVDGELKSSAVASGAALKGTAAVYGTGNGTKTEVYVVEGALHYTVRIVVINTYAVKAAADYDKTNKQVTLVYADDSTLGTVKTETFAAASEDVKKGDWFLATVDNDVVASLKKTAPVEGTVASYANTSAGKNSSVVLDGKTYSYAASYVGTDPVAYTLNKAAAVVLDDNGYILTVTDVAEAAKNYALVKEFALDGVLTTSKKVAGLYLTDGTYKEVELKAYPATTAAGIYTYDVEDGKYVLTALNDAAWVDTNAATKVTGNAVQFATGIGNKATENTQFFVINKADNTIKTYVGYKNLPNITTNVAVYTVNTASGSAFVKYAFIDAVPSANVEGTSTADAAYYYVYKTDRTYYKVSTTNDYYEYKYVLKDGVAEPLKTEGENFTAGKLYKNLSFNTNGNVSSGDSTTVAESATVKYGTYTTAYAISADGNVLVIASATYQVAENCNFVYIAKDGTVTNNYSLASVVALSKVVPFKTTAILNSTGFVTTMYIDALNN